MRFWLFFLIVSSSPQIQANGNGTNNEDGPLVETLNGPIRGFTFKLPVIQRQKTDIDSANIFLGVPYAEPPLKELRLEVLSVGLPLLLSGLFLASEAR